MKAFGVSVNAAPVRKNKENRLEGDYSKTTISTPNTFTDDVNEVNNVIVFIDC